MLRKPKGKSSWLAILLLVIAIGLKVYDQSHREKATPVSRPSVTTQTPTQSKPANHLGNYEVYPNCKLLPHHSNDGDSFLTRLPDGREVTLRLYYVDTPESQFRHYQNSETNFERIRQQAAEMGGITPEQAVDTGNQAKHYVLSLLEKNPFTIYTQWDSPFHDQRFHAFIEITEGGRKRWLHELLIEKGLARLKTKPAPLPDGTPVNQHMAYLRELQSTARKSKVGVWKY